jgi:C4-dicarboxylate transporter DctQ subunit
VAQVLAVAQRLQGWVSGALMAAMTFAYALNVVVREVAPSAARYFAWIEEVSLFGLVWMVFIGLSLALSSGRHIGMSMVLRRVPGGVQRPLKLIINALGLCFCVYLAKVGIEITTFVARSGQTSPTLGISVAYLYCAMPIGFALLAIQYLFELITPADRFAIELDPTHRL